ncbi:MAG: prepilin-type N-terminal cleavage/methylation domain-containing protein, partial [Candidatus Vogelbacteria bacterium]|nr:prepilin-type N-terminal cleavage/methylation domain-containing protein [Candidatus Vogelbacteria bacterium]
MLKNRKKGFTLIELLVVVAIIGILASVILVSLGSARAKARDARRISDVKQLQNGLELYYSTFGRYPMFSEVYPGGAPDNTYAYTSTACATANGPSGHCISPDYMPTPPTDPLSGVPYYYAGHKVSTQLTSDTKCLTYHLGTTLEQVTADSPVMKTAPHKASTAVDACDS